MTYTISKDFAFSAAHQLSHLPDEHPCSRMHGHNFIVKVTLASNTLDEVGFVMDYRELKPLGDFIDATFDHRLLNDVVEFSPTAENMTRFLYDWCSERGWPVASVAWSETPKTWASYTPSPAPLPNPAPLQKVALATTTRPPTE